MCQGCQMKIPQGSRWTFLSHVAAEQGSRRLVQVQCSCGTVAVHRRDSILSGNSRSCGCLRSEEFAAARTTHGHTKGCRGGRGVPVSKEYCAWQNAKRRCYSPRNASFASYGGRGIKVCERWRESFATFFDDMGAAPHGFSLDRIDPDGDYEPSNCRWADDDAQRNNQRRSRRLSWHGEVMTLAQLSRRTGVSRSCIDKRLARGWSAEQAATQQ